MIKLPCGILVRVDEILAVSPFMYSDDPSVTNFKLFVKGVENHFVISKEDFKVIEEMTDESE